MSQQKPVVAAFDFDGTLTTRDTLFPFLLHISNKTEFLLKAMRSMPTLIAYAFRFVPNYVAKERVLVIFLAGYSVSELQVLGKSFAENILPRLMRGPAMQRLYWHQSQGHRCVLISASLDVYLTPWAGSNGVTDVLCTTLDVEKNGVVTGRLGSKNCYGSEKQRRLEDLLGDRSKYYVYAYGDSRGDRELLESADVSFYRIIPESGTSKRDD